MRPEAKHFRVTLHRTLRLNQEELLQQACDYVGEGLDDASATAGRTMSAMALTIGAAYRTRRIVRTPRKASRAEIKTGMEGLDLRVAARDMKKDVSFVSAMPIVQPDDRHYAPGPVAAVLYLDSQDDDFWLADVQMQELSMLVEGAVRAMDASDGARLGRLRNFALERICDSAAASELSTGTDALEMLADVCPPSTVDQFVLNYDHTDLAPVTTKSTTLDS